MYDLGLREKIRDIPVGKSYSDIHSNYCYTTSFYKNSNNESFVAGFYGDNSFRMYDSDIDFRPGAIAYDI